MSDVYGVSAADVAAELPGLFPVGFTQATKPALATITLWIADADAYIDSTITHATELAPDIADQVAQLARRYIIDEVVARVYRAVYAGKAAPADIAALLRELGGSSVLTKIKEITDAAVALELTEEIRSVSVPYTTPQRDLMVDDTDLNPNSGLRGRW